MVDWWELAAMEPVDICKGANQSKQTVYRSQGTERVGYRCEREPEVRFSGDSGPILSYSAVIEVDQLRDNLMNKWGAVKENLSLQVNL